MFARVKKSGDYQYVQVVHNERLDGRVRQRVIATLDDWMCCNRADNSKVCWNHWHGSAIMPAVLNALSANQITPTSTIHLGPPLVFQRLWEELGLPGIFERLLLGRKFEFPLERVVFITVLPSLVRTRQRPRSRALVSQVRGGGDRRPRTPALLSYDGLLGEPLPQTTHRRPRP